VLEDERIYFDSFRNMNDPYEIFTFINRIETNETFVDRNVKDRIKITCFTKQYDNYLMWSHYGLKHQGICIAFNIPLIENTDIQTLKLDNNVVRFFCVLYEPIEISLTESEFQGKNIKNGIEACRRKYLFWNYEKEYRALIESSSEKYIKIPKNLIVGIYYGFNIFDDEMESIESRVEKSGYSIFHKKLKLISNMGLLN